MNTITTERQGLPGDMSACLPQSGKSSEFNPSKSTTKRSRMKGKATPIRLLVGEGSGVYRSGLRAVLSDLPQIQIVAEVGTVEEIFQKIPLVEPDLILMAVNLPDGSGIEACRQILSVYPDIRVLFLATVNDDDLPVGSLIAGAQGYILKEIDPGMMVRLIEIVMEGYSVFAQKALQRVHIWTNNQGSMAHSHPSGRGLSGQQYLILSWVTKGKTNKEIANSIGLSEKTVRNYLTAIFKKFKLTNRAEAAALFAKHFAE